MHLEFVGYPALRPEFLRQLTREFVMGSAGHNTARGLPASGLSISVFAYLVASVVVLSAVSGIVFLLVISPFVPESLRFNTQGMAWVVAFVELLAIAIIEVMGSSPQSNLFSVLQARC